MHTLQHIYTPTLQKSCTVVKLRFGSAYLTAHLDSYTPKVMNCSQVTPRKFIPYSTSGQLHLTSNELQSRYASHLHTLQHFLTTPFQNSGTVVKLSLAYAYLTTHLHTYTSKVMYCSQVTPRICIPYTTFEHTYTWLYSYTCYMQLYVSKYIYIYIYHTPRSCGQE